MRTSTMAGFVMAAAVAVPAMGDLLGPAFRIHASSPAGEGFFEVPQSWGQWNNGVWSWTASVPYAVPNMTVGGPALAMLTECAVRYEEDPVVSVAFNVTAGPSGSTFTITSALLSFAAISPAVGNASAGITFTDTGGDGATLTGLQPGARAYRAQYNGFGPGETDFASFISSQTVGPFATGIDSGNQPPTAIGVPVSSMRTQFMFSLTANDTVGGTSVFNVVVPAPGAASLLGIGGLLALRRRR